MSRSYPTFDVAPGGLVSVVTPTGQVVQYRAINRVHFRETERYFSTEPSQTQGYLADGLTAAEIVEKFSSRAAGIDGHMQAVFADLSHAPRDSFEAMQQLRDMHEIWADIPVGIRDFFGHSPEAFVSFLSDEENYGAAVEMGLFPSGVSSSPAEMEEEKEK